jgi:hypothetical protein
MNNCVTCEHAIWQKTPSGRINWKKAGKCRAPMPDLTAVLPACVPPPPASKNSIWPDTCTNCPTWIKKETPQ